MFERSRQKMFARDKHNHIIGRVLKLVPIGFARETIDMVLHRLCVPRHGDGANVVIHGGKSVLIIVQRHLGVDNQRPPARDMNNRVRPQAKAITCINAGFEVKIDMFR